MSHIFTYTDSASITTTLTFTRALMRGDKPYYTRNQDTGISKGGTPYARSYGTALKTQPLTVRVPITSVSETDWDDVIDFIVNKVDFEIHQFTWTDENSKSYTVIMQNDDTKPNAEYVNYVDYTFQLLVLVAL